MRQFVSKYPTVFLVVLLSVNTALAVEFDPPIAITGATVVTEPGKQIDDAAVVMESGRITAVGTSVNVPPDAKRIDGSGLYVYAGFIDAASHVGMPEGAPPEAMLARVSDEEIDPKQMPRTGMWLANRRGIWPHLTLDDRYTNNNEKLGAYRNAGFTTALVVPHTAILAGWGDVMQLSGRPMRHSVVKPEVVQLASFFAPRGASTAPFVRRGYPVSAMGAVALMRQMQYDIDWYQHRTRRAERGTANAGRALHDPVLEAAARIFNQGQRVLFAADSPNQIHHALDLANEFDWDVVILGGAEAWRVADRLNSENAAVIATLDWDEKPKLAPKVKKKSDDSEPDLLTTLTWSAEWEDDFFEPLALRREKIRQWEEQVNNIAVLTDAGVPVGVTGRDLKGPGKILDALQQAAELGLTADQALEVLTTGPARILGVDDSLGSIEKGNTANLTVLTKPFGDEDAKVRHVFIDGDQFTMEVKGGKASKDDDGESGEDASDEKDEEESGVEEEKEEKTPPDNHPWVIETDADRKPSRIGNGSILLTNATVITMANGTLENTDVLVQKGKIRKIGKDLKAPDSVSTIDLSGYWVMPGIIDPHSHMAIAGGINEGSDSVTVEVRITDEVDHTQLALYRALAGGITTIHTMHGSANTMGGQNAILKMKYLTSPAEMLDTDGPRIVKFALGENVTRASSNSRTRYPGSRMGVESVLRQAFSEALEYAKARDQKDGESVRRDIRLDALNDILNGDIWIHSHCYRADEILRLLAVAEDFGVRVATLQHVLEGYRIVPEMRRHGVGGSTFSDWWAYKIEAYNAIPQNAAMMMRGGVVSSLNSDSADLVRYMNLEAGKSMRFGGLTADEALKLITINPAIQIGRDDRIGSIEEGKDGDIAVFTRHPLDTHSHCALTIVEGEVYFRHPDFIPGTSGPASDWTPSPPRTPISVESNAAGRYAIRGATVHPVSSEPIASGVVLIDRGKLVEVGEMVSIPSDYTIVDATGLHVYPGLINADTALGLLEIDSINATNDTRDLATYQPDIKAVSAVNPFAARVGVALCEGITTAAVHPSGGLISGGAGLIQLDGWSMPEMLRDPEIGLVVDLPSLPAAMDSERRGERMKSHRKSIEGIEQFIQEAQHYAEIRAMAENDKSISLPVNVKLEAMIPFVRGEKPVMFSARTYKEILEVTNFAEVFDLDPIIVGGDQAWKCADMLAEKNIPVIVNSVLEIPNDEYTPFDANYGNAAKLNEAGVTFCIATGSNYEVEKLPVFAGMAAAHGLSPEASVASITLNAAKILGKDSEIGSLEPGKIADVIITSGEVTQASSRTVVSFIGGHPVELTSKQEESYNRFSNRPEPDLPEAPVNMNGPEPMRTTQ
jgi:imidazolonepropionase-like amidohydrolase